MRPVSRTAALRSTLFLRGGDLWATYSPGLLLVGTIAVAAQFLGDHYGAPVMLFALLIGMAFNFLAEGSRCTDGIAFGSKFLLRLGVALLGLRISASDSWHSAWSALPQSSGSW